MKELVNNLYWYFTDFCVNAANLLDITYVKFNFWLFVVLFPSIVTILILLNAFRNKIAFLSKNAIQK